MKTATKQLSKPQDFGCLSNGSMPSLECLPGYQLTLLSLWSSSLGNKQWLSGRRTNQKVEMVL